MGIPFCFFTIKILLEQKNRSRTDADSALLFIFNYIIKRLKR